MIVRLAIAAMLFLLGVLVGAGGLGWLLRQPSFDSSAATRHSLPSAVMDLELVAAVEGYASLHDGSVIWFELDGGSLSTTELARGLISPRGIAVAGDTVYVVDARCDTSTPSCQRSTAEEEAEIIANSNGAVLAIPRAGGEPVAILDGLPVVGRDHAPNDLEVGPDGMLYLSIGHADYSWDRFELLDHSNLGWLGTILRIDPLTGDAEVMARGVRNIYGLAWTDDGRLLGVDNDGPTHNGWRDEELVELRPGGHYGFPDDPSVGPGSVRTEWPIVLVQSVASAGITAYDGGVFVGNCGSIQRIPLREIDGRLQLDGQRSSFETVLRDIRGCVTAIGLTPTGLLAGIYGPSGGALVEMPMHD